jgi:nicotinamide phosphoribosyltransferase
MRFNPIHATDFYKTGHFAQFPEGTTKVYSNFTCRSDKWANVLPDFDHKVVFFGLQGVVQWLLTDVWNREFFGRPKRAILREYKARMDGALGVGAVGTDHISALHDLGYLPLLIKALPEGSRVDMRIPLFTITNTHPDFYWLTNYVETQLSAEMWKMITSATTAYEYRRLLDRYAEKTGADKAFVPFQGHDFSMRGMSGIIDAAQSGAAHLLSFTGTDTIPALDYLAAYYGGDAGGFIGGSVPATEHSVVCMGGEDGELETFRRLITEVYPSGIVSLVSDSWDYWNVITNTANTLSREIMARDGRCVFRPDSGDPVKIICGDPEAPDGSPECLGSVQCLYDLFPGPDTAKGYKTLDPHVGLIYGDSITLERAQQILAQLEAKGFASSNIVFGVGSFTYQLVTRDNFGTAIKATYGIVNGQPRELFKKPKTDSGAKISARGLLRVEYEDGHFVLHERQTPEQERMGLLSPVFEDGKLIRRETLTDIRRRLLGDA